MPCRWMTGSALCALLVGGVLTASGAAADAVYAPIPAAQVRERILQSLPPSTPEAVRTRVTERWPAEPSVLPADRTLMLAIESWTLIDPALAPLLRAADSLDPAGVPALVALVERPGQDPFQTNNLRAWLGRAFAEQRWYDEALVQLRAVDKSQAIDPASVLFYQAVASQTLLDLPAARTALQDLLQKTSGAPPRYRTTAELMLAEIETVKEKSLDEIARLMSDSERRLDLGRAGEQVQGVQERIIANLDELIKKLEAQGGGGGGGGGQGGNSNESSNPAQDSSVKGATAPGETDKRKFSKEGNWGDLPEKKQTEAKNLINRNYPAHYRQAIETYFKKLSGRPAAPSK